MLVHEIIRRTRRSAERHAWYHRHAAHRHHRRISPFAWGLATIITLDVYFGLGFLWIPVSIVFVGFGLWRGWRT